MYRFYQEQLKVYRGGVLKAKLCSNPVVAYDLDGVSEEIYDDIRILSH